VTHLQDPSFFEHVCETLARNAVAPWQVRLEVTESVAMAESGSASEVLGRLDRLGIKIVLDDFGTQYSSLKYLQRLPIDTIKIDRCFVSGLPANGHDAAIVRGVIALGHDLRRTIVAEGVETREQLEWLREADCDIAQGFFIEKPMPPDRFIEWCESHGRAGNLVQLRGRLPVRSSA
jgi:EAL domain-containing protein (putative c-di-GMP-specific phosphodiesterase class I)